MTTEWMQYADVTRWADGSLGWVHLVAGLAAVAIGPVILLGRKGTVRHRVYGYVYVALMMGLNLSALSMYELNGRPNLFHLFAVISLLTILPGIYCAIRARRRGERRAIIAHYHFMSWSYFGLLAALFSQIVTRIDPAILGLDLPPRAMIVYGVGIAAIGASIFINVRAGRIVTRYVS